VATPSPLWGHSPLSAHNTEIHISGGIYHGWLGRSSCSSGLFLFGQLEPVKVPAGGKKYITWNAFVGTSTKAQEKSRNLSSSFFLPNTAAAATAHN